MNCVRLSFVLFLVFASILPARAEEYRCEWRGHWRQSPVWQKRYAPALTVLWWTPNAELDEAVIVATTDPGNEGQPDRFIGRVINPPISSTIVMTDTRAGNPRYPTYHVHEIVSRDGVTIDECLKIRALTSWHHCCFWFLPYIETPPC